MIEDLKQLVKRLHDETSEFITMAEVDFFDYGEETEKQRHAMGCARMLTFSAKEAQKIVDKWEYLDKYTIS
jgi:hypothetical protein